ncbi:sulfite exporter TauE/SafE family protein [Roseburia hominis]
MSGLMEGGAVVLLVIAAANGVIGGLIGICGIAGFLLPMLYTGVLGYSVEQSLAFSFLAFLVSGILGSVNYKKAGNLDIPMSVRIGMGSFAGAVAGVFLQAMISKSAAKTILYLVVLLSGISILCRMWNEKRQTDAAVGENGAAGENAVEESNMEERGGLMEKTWFLPLLGAVTGAICSLSGAGGPVLVMPLLITFGVSARLAVGVSLFDSVFIAIPACVGYLSRIDIGSVWVILLIVLVAHGAGVLAGSRMAGKVPVTGLKIFVAVFSVFISIYMLL